MLLTFRVDQKEALRRGIDASNSTCKLEVDPSTLSQRERDLLAEVMRDGHDCTRAVSTQNQSLRPITLISPDQQGLHDALAVALAERDKAIAEHETANRHRRERADNNIRKAIAEAGTEEKTLHFSRDGKPSHWTQHGYVSVTVPDWPAMPEESTYYASEEAEEELEAARQAVERKREEYLDRLAPVVADKIAQRQASELRAKEDYDALFVRLPEALRERHQAGYATDQEVHKLMRRLARQDAGYPPENPEYESRSKLDTLTDEQFAALKQIERSAPAGAEVEPYEIYDGGGYRPATEDDDPDDIDSDYEVAVPRENERQVARVTWTVGDLEVAAYVPLS